MAEFWHPTAISASPGARVYYDQLRARGVGHQAVLRQLGHRLVGILHGCLAPKRCYDEAIAWPRTTGPVTHPSPPEPAATHLVLRPA